MAICNVNSVTRDGSVIFYVNVVYFAVDGFITPAYVVGIIFACEVCQCNSKDRASPYSSFWALKKGRKIFLREFVFVRLVYYF